MSVTYTAALTVREETVLFVSRLLHAERVRRGTRTGTRALSCFKQAVLVIRWFLDGTRVAQLAGDNAIGKSTAYTYLHEGIGVLAAHAPGLEAALPDEKKAFNKAHNGVRAIGDRGNSLLKTTLKPPRNVSLCPWKISGIVAAALVLPHVEHNRTP